MRIVLIVPLPFIPAEFTGLDEQPVTVVFEDNTETIIQLRGTTTESAVKLGKELAAQRGWSPAQFDCVRDLWMKESNWRWKADNKQSTAFGIPQILRLSESLTPEEQIIRGYEYIEHRYDTACKAWSFWQKNFYY
jgi:hypothetical protein